MKIHFECFGIIRTKVGKKEVTLELEEGINAEEALKHFGKTFGSEVEELLFNDGKLASFFSIQVDNDQLDADKLKVTTLKEGQKISIIPFVAGG